MNKHLIPAIQYFSIVSLVLHKLKSCFVSDLKMMKSPLKTSKQPPGNLQNGSPRAMANISDKVQLKHAQKNPQSQITKLPAAKVGGAVKEIVSNITVEEILERTGESDAKAVNAVNLHACGITRIMQLERFQNIVSLDLSCNAITKIENLCNSTLTELKLYGNMITTVSGLLDLKNLETLCLQHNRINRINDGFSGQKKLKTLRLDSNQLSQIEPRDFTYCRSLESLDISHNYLESLSALKFASCLKDLAAVGNRLKRIDCQGNLTLVDLDLSFNNIDDVSNLSCLVNLQVLRLTNNQISSLQPMGELKRLLELHIGSNQLTNLNYIRKQFPNLDYLDVTNNRISDWKHFEYLKFCPSVRELYISGNPCVSEVTDADRKSLKNILPNAEIVDGKYLNAADEKSALYSKRAASASTAITVRQLENELNSLSVNLDENENNILRTFRSIRDLMSTLPLHPPRSRDNDPTLVPGVDLPSSRLPTSRSSSRARIEEARLFAASLSIDDDEI